MHRISRGVYFLANDRVIDLAIAFLNSFRTHNPTIPLCLVPFSDNISRILSLQSVYQFSIFPNSKLLSICDEVSKRFHGTVLGHYRKLALWEGIFDEFIYIDLDTVVLTDVEFVFPFLLKYRFVTSHSDFPKLRQYVWKDSIIGTKQLTDQQIAFSANTGFIASKKGALPFAHVQSKINQGVRLVPHMQLNYCEQPFLNYLIVTSNKPYTSLLVLSRDKRFRDLPLELWAGTKGLKVENGQINSKRPVLLMHWAGVWQGTRLGNDKSTPNHSMPYLELWNFYRNMAASRLPLWLGRATKNHPLVSCLMVTLGGEGRLELIKKSIDCYCRQTYLHKELVIVGDNLSSKNKAQLLKLVASFKRQDIRCLFPKGKRTLGALRNFSMDNAKGEIICQWDDDDLSHPDRVKVQLDYLLKRRKGAVYLRKTLQYFTHARQLFMLDFGKYFPRCHTASLLAYKDARIRYPEKGAHARKGEDIELLREYQKKSNLWIIQDKPYLYAYLFHGANTWDYSHHRGLAMGLAVSTDEMYSRRRAIQDWIKSFDFGRGHIDIMSQDGLIPNGSSKNPLVSCLMVTMGGKTRLEFIKKSIDCYCRQTYPNKELVIVGDNLSLQEQSQLLKLVASFKREDIRCLFPKGKRTLGALRNFSMDNAKSEIICQWDDDDLYHPDRIKVQLAALLEAGKGAVYLSKSLQFWTMTRQLYLLDFSRYYPGCHTGSLMCFRNSQMRYLETGKYSHKNEDGVMMHSYKHKSSIKMITDMPHLYVCVFHGENTLDYKYHQNLVIGLAVRQNEMLRQHQAIRRWIKSFDFGRGHIDIMSQDGLIPNGSSKNPLVSCLMVTMGGKTRLEFIKKSIGCYCRQTYLHKELVIVGDNLSPQEQSQLLKLVASFKREDIRCLFPKGKRTLGALRNFSMDNAKSEIICQWDDDDLYHPDRVKVQLTALLEAGKGAIYLQKFLHFYAPTRELFLGDYDKSNPPCHTATLACFRNRQVRYPEKGPQAVKGEDTSLLYLHMENDGVNMVANAPPLYAYMFHGTNTYGYMHHRAISMTTALSIDEINRQKGALQSWIKSFDFGAGRINLMARDGMVAYAR